jgi:hypothetical protein
VRAGARGAIGWVRATGETARYTLRVCERARRARPEFRATGGAIAALDAPRQL